MAIEKMSIDFTLGIDKHRNVMNEVASTTYFNTSPFDTWKTAFRECTKLSSNSVDQNKNLLNT
ncbi:hypothetical protein R0K19_28545, partial [Bacillus sp. SIMBA_161]